MLNQVIHWIQMTGTVVDGLLLLRILLLKLQRTYVFLTLFCGIEFLFDIAAWVLGWDSRATEHIFFYSRFLYAVLFPLMAWDVFEEMPKQILKLRRAFGVRLVTGIFVSAIFGLLVYATFDDQDVNSTSAITEMAGMVVWTGSSSASLAFVWSLYRLLRKQKIATPHNTAIWMKFYLLSLLSSILYLAFLFFTASLSETQRNAVALVFLFFDLGLTGWCIVRLRALPSEDRPATEIAGA